MPPSLDANVARAIGARIRGLREEANLTQETLAWDCDLAKAYLSQIEAGKRTPSVQVLFALAARLGVQPADLLITDTTNPRMELAEAVRRRDADSIESALKRIGLPRGPSGKR